MAIETLEIRALRAWYDENDDAMDEALAAMNAMELTELANACEAIAADARTRARMLRGAAPRQREGHDFEGDGMWCGRRGCHKPYSRSSSAWTGASSCVG